MERAEPYQNGLKENKRAKRDAVIRQVCVHFVILLFLFFVALPIWFLVIKSFKSPDQEISSPFSLSFPFFMENYKLAWLFVKDYIDDPDGYEGLPFTRFYADCIGSGTPIMWSDML